MDAMSEELMGAGRLGEPGTLTWLGHATVLMVTSTGTRVVFDPWFENPKSPVSMDGVGSVDVIAVTHGHFDHMGSVVPLALATGATVVCVPEMAAYFATQGLANVVEMNKGGTVRVADIGLTMVTADHSCGVAAGDGLANIYGGNPVGYIAHLPEGSGGPVYVSGDTNVFGDMALIRELYAPEIALMPIDGHYNMGPLEAAYAVMLLGVSRFTPIHFGTFPLLAGTPEEVARHLVDREATARVVSVEPGGSVPLARQ